MITTKNSKDLVLFNCHELPETVCVETRFITQAAAKQKKNEQILYLTNKNNKLELTRQTNPLATINTTSIAIKPATVTLSIQSKPTTSAVASVPQSQPQTTGTIVPLATTLTNLASTNNLITANINPAVVLPLGNTTGLIPATYNLNASVVPVTTNSLNIATNRNNINEQLQQTTTEVAKMNSIGIQCKLDEELEWPPITAEESIVNQEYSVNVKETFLKFVQDNSTQHKHCKECLICGEICKSDKYFYGHMEIHRGPKVLCFKCGKYLDSEQLVTKHNCRKSQQLEKAFLQCPFYNCGVLAISRLELYDHINEHSNDRMYKCSGCNRGFCTGQEFLRHLLIRAKCYTTAKRKRFRVYGLEFPKDRLCRVRVFTLHTFKKRTTMVKSFLSQRVPKRGVCKICLKSFANNKVYNRHRAKCVVKFRKRLVRKRLEAVNA